MHAHGSMPRLIGKNVADLTDPDGHPIIREMVRIASQKGEGVLAYKWRNPVTKGVENKRAYLQRVGDYLVAVGYYEP